VAAPVLALKAAWQAVLLAALAALAACQAAAPLVAEGVDPALTPQAVLTAWPGARGAPVLWGGVIVQTVPRGEWTEIEVLAYPLDTSQRPRTTAPALGRFFMRAAGLLEPLDFAPGRALSVRGNVQEIGQGMIGQASYRFPVVAANSFYLWPAFAEGQGSAVQFGFGVVIGN